MDTIAKPTNLVKRLAMGAVSAVETLHVIPLEDDQGLIDKTSKMAHQVYCQTKKRVAELLPPQLGGRASPPQRPVPFPQAEDAKWFRGGDDWDVDDAGEPSSAEVVSPIESGWEMLHLPLKEDRKTAKRRRRAAVAGNPLLDKIGDTFEPTIRGGVGGSSDTRSRDVRSRDVQSRDVERIKSEEAFDHMAADERIQKVLDRLGLECLATQPEPGEEYVFAGKEGKRLRMEDPWSWRNEMRRDLEAWGASIPQLEGDGVETELSRGA